MGNSITIISKSVRQTIELGNLIGKNLRPGTVISLAGNLGAGKTHLIKGIAQGLDVPDYQDVTSPTFTLMNEYEGRLMIYHIDAWRLTGSGQLEAVGFDELCSGPAIVLVEWADRTSSIVDSYDPIHVVIEHVDENTRKIIISDLPENLVQALATA
ncbi:MAG: tRNA (adenosine(37)-N6)-threonylcarbamoyltransferase complex ATPase subunit type 1 TsaE [Sedimentisphaerales bacterium]|nr:tRNA (adenosine(37)-N6)-threonylcarbamoyltransferase complex ATPase subunit type 1 TsaE [Sedimentisphaerales bacterium]MBN2842962.1 tRNA (adenosine(37)-N6)-threonylcarbamoyltransferase complex ATPase subunit type 1 TsaE [Sedimentisphaerales bacterium]